MNSNNIPPEILQILIKTQETLSYQKIYTLYTLFNPDNDLHIARVEDPGYD